MSRGNDFPPYLSRPATHRGYGDANLSPSLQNEQLRWDHQPSFQDNARFAAPTEYRPSEDRLAVRSFRLASVPLDPYLPTRIIIFNNNMGSRGTGHRFPPVPDQVTPIFLNQQNTHSPSRTNESMLNQEEQETVLRKLKREIYNPVPKMLARRVSLYYRDLNRDPNKKAVENEHNDEDRKSCAVCLEDFEPREEVMVTPCSHMFHEECIVPWLKSHGQCPVCRFALFDRREENCSNLNSSSNNRNDYNNYIDNSNRRATLTANNDMFAGELISLIQAVDEAFPWRAYS